jgi:hypothetical protein
MVLPKPVGLAFVALQRGTFTALHIESIGRLRVGLHEKTSGNQAIPSRHFSDNHSDLIEPVDSVPIILGRVVVGRGKQEQPSEDPLNHSTHRLAI